jgi:hypothetical protein
MTFFYYVKEQRMFDGFVEVDIPDDMDADSKLELIKKAIIDSNYELAKEVQRSINFTIRSLSVIDNTRTIL